MIKIDIEIKNADEVIRFLNERPAKARELFNKAIKKAILSVEREAKQRTPVRTGRLRASLISKQYQSVLEGEVSTDVYYAIYVHENLRARHKIGEAKFLENAVKVLEPKINAYFEEAADELIK